LVNRHNLENQHLELLSNEVQNLRSRLNWLSGLSVAVLILAAVIAGLMLSVKLQQDQHRQRAETLTGDQTGVESQVKSLNQQVKSLNQQVKSLNQQVKSLNQQVAIKASKAQIKPLQAIIQEINSKYITRVQLNTALKEVQQS
jgi:peptidoglycan hydrolase CwlO-like protein